MWKASPFISSLRSLPMIRKTMILTLERQTRLTAVMQRTLGSTSRTTTGAAEDVASDDADSCDSDAEDAFSDSYSDMEAGAAKRPRKN